MKNIQLSALLFLLGLCGVCAQETVLTSGGDASGTGGTSSYSVGQIVTTTNTGTSGSVAQGVQQPYEISATVGIEVEYINLEMVAYPNPTSSQLTLKLEGVDFKSFSYQLYDLNGRLLMDEQIQSSSSQVNMDGLEPATYLLQVKDNQKELKTFKIIKN